MRVIRLFLSSFSLYVLLLNSTCAPSGVANAQTTPQATAVSNVDEVSVDLAAYSNHRPVLDLNAQDVRLTDAGVAVPISSFRLVRRDSEPKLLTLLFDRLDADGRANALKLAAKILKSLPASGVAITVLGVQGQLRLHQEFTSDFALVTRAIDEATQKNAANTDARMKDLVAAAKRGRDATGKPIATDQSVRAQVLLAALQDAQALIHDQHPTPSLAALLALARSEKRLAGQKALFFITQDPMASPGDGPALVSIVASANRSAVKIFAVDANTSSYVSQEYLQAFASIKTTMSLAANTGIVPQVGQAAGQAMGPPPGPPSVQPAGQPLGAMGDVTRVAGMTDFEKHRYDSLEVQDRRESPWVCRLAKNTGGACLQPEKNPQDIVRQAIEDMTTYYEVSFVPAAKQYDGKFHAIKVKALRGGLKLRSRPGYFALPPESDSNAQAFEVPLLKILNQPALPDDVKFQSRVLQLGNWNEGNANAVVVEVPIAQLETRDDPNTNLYSSQIAALIQIKDKSGEVVEYFAEDLAQHGSLADKQHGVADHMRVQRYFIADPGEYEVEVAVLDRNSGKAAGQRSTFRIADAPHAPFLSDVGLVARMEPLPPGAAVAEPLRYGDARVVLDLSGQAGGKRKQVSIFSIVHLDPQTKEQAHLSVSLARNGETLAQVPLPLRTDDRSAVHTHVATIETSSLPAGRYQVVETLAQGAATFERSADFQVSAADATISPASLNTAPESRPAEGPGENAGAAEPVIAAARPIIPAIVELPPASIVRPTAEVFQAMLAAATKYAIRYSESLPNFICMEVTKRSVDATGRGDWRARDSFTHLLRYDGNEETRTWLESNGHEPDRKNGDPSSAWPTSVGQFGGLLRVVFNPASKTSFEWKSAALLGDDTVQVLSYVVSAEHATMGLRGNGRLISVGFHGLIYLDASTGGIRRITVEADNIPRDFSFRSTAMAVDYDYINIGSHEYLLPTHATVTLQRTSQKMELNDIVFRNYTRFAAKSRIIVPPQ